MAFSFYLLLSRDYQDLFIRKCRVRASGASGAGRRASVMGRRKSLDISTGLDLEPMNWYSITIKEDKDA